MRQTAIFGRITVLIVTILVVLLGVISFPTIARADTLWDLYGTTYDKADVYNAGDGDPTSLESSSSLLFSFSSTTLSPMSFSDEMLYFCKYESGCNYDQGLSPGDGYHAMGYFQFDNRYGLGNFLEAVYNYNSTTYAALATIGDKYDWDVSGTTWENGSFTTLGNDLNTAWHAAYEANPTEFSQLQNGWAYQQYYASSDGIRGSLEAMGIDIDSRADCVKGLCWGLSNLFGKGGGADYVNAGYYYGANWFIKNSGVNNSMSDTEFVTTLCNYVINNVSTRYPSQSEYWEGWQNRYRNELADCLSYLSNISMYRLYNPNSGEHFYTSSASEKATLVSAGWHYEGIGWTAPSTSTTPVYRLYNPNAGDHFYTTSASERDSLVSAGWNYEGVSCNSASSSSGVPVYRLYNPNSGTHFYTTSSSEKENLVSLGWHYEGIGWYGVDS